jgi:predicted O-methyltransferase YrrM
VPRVRLTTVLRNVAELSQRFRVNVTPHHFYSDFPDLRALRQSTSWRCPFSMQRIQGAEIGPQLGLVERCTRPYHEAMRGVHERASATNGETGYGPIEAQFLYCFVRTMKPRNVIQIGCGVSTAVLAEAACAEPGYAPRIICIDPYPTNMLRKMAAQGQITLLEKRAEDVEIERLSDLNTGDLLFVDSTHTVKVGSEVVKIICEVLPYLTLGVFVHFHDITFPYDYSPKILHDDIFFSRETTLLYAYLLHNPRCRIEASLSMLHHAEPGALQRAFPDYRPAQLEHGLLVRDGHFPSSVYMRTC